jgi:hypothetical protein
MTTLGPLHRAARANPPHSTAVFSNHSEGVEWEKRQREREVTSERARIAEKRANEVDSSLSSALKKIIADSCATIGIRERGTESVESEFA